MTTTTEVQNVRRPVESRDPNSGEVWRQFEHASPEAIVTAVKTAGEAQRAWGAIPLRERAAAVGRVRREIYERRHAIASVLSRETGKPPFEAIFETLLVADTAAWAAREGARLLRPVRRRSRQIATLRKSIETQWEPFGVVAVISPWNYPLLLAAGSLLPSLVAGNAVILKPSEMTPTCAEALVEAVRATGIPEGLVQWLPGDGETGRALIEGGVNRVFFTGSEATGRKVAAACGERLIPCSLELGGSDPALVLDDADIPTAAAGIAWGRFSNAGQTCIAPKRVFVVDSIYDRFV
ncbi:MAG: aldehyde dehydrogenase family protein, partial [Thermoanaerobaculia bacterium]